MGEQVGMAQRMESVASPGAVMLSESTARLVEGAAVLGEPEMVRIRGADDLVPACRLLSVAEHRRIDRSESTFVGREWEMSTVAALLDQAINGKGHVVGVVGPPGIGKSRIVRETAILAERSGVDVFATYCESHTRDIVFHVVSGLLRAALGITDLNGAAARERVRGRI